MTHRRFIKMVFVMYPQNQGFTCADLVKRVKIHFGLSSKYLNGSISSTLARMVTNGEIEVDSINFGPKNGKIYIKGKNFII